MNESGLTAEPAETAEKDIVFSAISACSAVKRPLKRCAQQAIVWNAKKLTKRFGGKRYLQVRRLLLRHGNDVEWGDQSM